MAKKNAGAALQAAVDVAQAALDLKLLYRGNVEVDRFHLHTQRLRVHAARRDRAGVSGEVAVLGWIRDRLTRSAIKTTERPGRRPLTRVLTRRVPCPERVHRG